MRREVCGVRGERKRGTNEISLSFLFEQEEEEEDEEEEE